MAIGEYIVDRWLVKAIRHIADERGLGFHSFSDDWCIELSNGSITKRILGYKFDLNYSVSAHIAEDKVAAATILQSHSVPTVPHQLIQTKATEYTWGHPDWNAVVVKPLVGSGGIGVHLFNEKSEVAPWITQQKIEAWAVSPFMDIQKETRLITLDGNVLLAYEKQPVELEGLRMFNLGLGATPKKVNPSNEYRSLAKKSCEVLQLRLAAVDIIELKTGEILVMEVNDGIMMEHYARVSNEYEQDASLVYEKIVTTMFENVK